MIAEMLSGPVNLSGENKATCHCNPERKKTRIKDQKAPFISKKRHSYKEMTARLIINPRPLWFQQKLARVSSLRSDRSPPSLYSKCPAHIFYLMRFQSSFNIYLDRHFLSEVLQKPARQNESPAPSCSQLPGLCWCSAVGSQARSCVTLIHTSQRCWGSLFNHLLFTHRAWQKVWWLVIQYSKISSTKLLEWMTVLQSPVMATLLGVYFMCHLLEFLTSILWGHWWRHYSAELWIESDPGAQVASLLGPMCWRAIYTTCVSLNVLLDKTGMTTF